MEDFLGPEGVLLLLQKLTGLMGSSRPKVSRLRGHTWNEEVAASALALRQVALDQLVDARGEVQAPRDRGARRNLATSDRVTAVILARRELHGLRREGSVFL